MINSQIIYQNLKKHWGFDSFRSPQDEIVQNILDHKDCFVILATGGGKSLCFQLPAIIKEGVTIVISPLIALMEDQIKGLNDKGIKAIYLNSTLLPSEEKKAYKNIEKSVYKLIYFSPEKLMSLKVQSLLKKINISMIVFDEVHCLSQWGHDFRPDYKRVAESVKENFNNIQVVALTATLTEKAQEDIVSILKLKDPFISKSSFDRKNIYLGIKKFWTIYGKFKFLKDLINNSHKTLIYCSSRLETEKMSKKLLNEEGLKTSFYHAGCSSNFRKDVQEKFKTGDINCLFATTAFGMGIDISDIDLVIYWNCASSIEDYYQGIGRAGRNEKIEAKSWVLYNSRDINLQKQILTFEIPDKSLIKKIINSINSNESINKIRSKLKVSETVINSTGLILEEIKELKQQDQINYIIKELKQIQKNKIDKFNSFNKYLKRPNCKRKFLLSYFSEVSQDKCFNCIYCKKLIK